MLADFLNEEQQMNKDSLILPLEYTKILVGEEFVASEILIQDNKNQIYAKSLQGQSTLYFKNGNEYIGEMHKGMMHGKGTMKWESGIKYEGEFAYNAITGVGEYFWPDGSNYKGQVLSGLRHGSGKYIAAGEVAIYEGEWLDGQRSGIGKISFPSGASYEGQFLNGVKHGKGIFKYPSGNIYEGEFFNDKKHGQGTMFWLNSSEKYYGAWENNLQNGFGCHIWLEGKGEKKLLRNRYEGHWKDGERHGHGVFFYANGSKYDGEWHRNLKQGFAVFTEDNGNTIQGYFKADKLVRNVKDDPIQMSIHLDQTNPLVDDSSNQQPESPLQLNTSTNSPKKLVSTSKTKLPLNNAAAAAAASQRGSVMQASMKTRGSVNPAAIVPITAASQPSQNVLPTNDALLKKMSIFKPNSISEFDDQRRQTVVGKGHTATKQATQTSQHSAGLQKELQENPYATILDYSDLDVNFLDANAVHSAVDTVLLRYNSLLISWFKDCVTKFDSSLGENSFCMDLGQVWSLIREIKVLGDSVTLAGLNRCFMNGSKNRFELTQIGQNQSDKLSEFNLMKQFGRHLSAEELADLPLLAFLHGAKNPMSSIVQQTHHNASALSSMQQISIMETVIEEGPGAANSSVLSSSSPAVSVPPMNQLEYTAQIRLHTEATPILFRHFADIIVRLAFLRAKNPDAMHTELENIVENHLKPWNAEQGRKIKTAAKQTHEEEMHFLMNKSNVIEKGLSDLLHVVFDSLKKVHKTAKFGSIDETCFLKDLIKLLKEAGFAKNEHELALAQSVIEITYDPSCTMAYVDNLSRERDREREREQAKQQSRRNQKAAAAPTRRKTPDFARMKDSRLSRILNAELIYFEFVRITLAHLIKAVKEQVNSVQKMDDDSLERRVRHLLEKVVRISQNNSAIVPAKKQAKQWPESVKDLMKVELGKERLRKVEQDKERRRRDDERKREQRERAQMMLQDVNIPSDIEEDSFDDY